MRTLQSAPSTSPPSCDSRVPLASMSECASQNSARASSSWPLSSSAFPKFIKRAVPSAVSSAPNPSSMSRASRNFSTASPCLPCSASTVPMSASTRAVNLASAPPPSAPAAPSAGAAAARRRRASSKEARAVSSWPRRLRISPMVRSSSAPTVPSKAWLAFSSFWTSRYAARAPCGSDISLCAAPSFVQSAARLATTSRPMSSHMVRASR
mmetsp:Transcript_86098/g.219381  ORF Transcript_86098/g.219381 Transcript_86098/m.219381 type:complete len:210 (-) Transcript_86098:125-754(-)